MILYEIENQKNDFDNLLTAMVNKAKIIEQNLERYSIQQWGEQYFGITAEGLLAVNTAKAKNTSAYAQPVPLVKIVEAAREQGMSLPLLLRFEHILQDRIDDLYSAFQEARQKFDYQNEYQIIYPIKVNQQAGVVRAIVSHGDDRLGLEAGSKPELLQVLALASAGSSIVCNGYKDETYLRLALQAQKLGYKVFIVIEKLEELKRLIRLTDESQLRPRIGIRIRLASITEGNWQNTGGEKSKFGLSVSQMLTALELIDQAGLSSSLNMLHVHLGSQIPNIRTIQKGVREVVRYYLNLKEKGFSLEVLDLGGGLGVDYDGTRSRNLCSMNYTVKQYAHAIVRTVSEMCEQHGQTVPKLMTESGRALTAHHAVLVTDVIEREELIDFEPDAPAENAPLVLLDLYEAYLRIKPRNAREIYQEALHWVEQSHNQFVLGVLSLEDRAQAEKLYQAVCQKVRNQLNTSFRAQAALLDELNEKLAEKWFCNFSIFQSLPDIWAIGQHFPIVPLQKLEQTPDRYALIKDLTCDSDGRVDRYVQEDGVEPVLSVHEFGDEDNYLLGFFMSGAYQEILGDMHNLFGDSDSVNVRIQGDGFEFDQISQGDKARDLFEYVGFEVTELEQAYRQKLENAELDQEELEILYQQYQEALGSSTYLRPDVG